MKIYAVIDTNVIVSSFLKRDSLPDQVVRYATDRTIVPVINDKIIAEYQDVLLRNKFGIEKQIVDDFLDRIIKVGINLDETKTDEIFEDLDDIVFYEVTLTAISYQEAYLVTGNKKHFPLKPFVVTPREMIEIINQKING